MHGLYKHVGWNDERLFGFVDMRDQLEEAEVSDYVSVGIRCHHLNVDVSHRVTAHCKTQLLSTFMSYYFSTKNVLYLI